MAAFFNLNTIFLFLGGIFSLFLMVVIVYSRQESKRKNERERLNKFVDRDAESIGDIEQKLNDSYDFRKLSFIQELTNYGLQPLFIIGIVNLFNRPILIIDVVLAFGLVMFIIMHEFWSSSRYSSKKWYQIIMLSSWIILFVYISLTNN